MARRFWKDRAVERPRTFTIQNNPDGTVTLIPAPGAIVEPGTPVNAANLNGLEEDLETHMDKNASQDNVHGLRDLSIALGVDSSNTGANAIAIGRGAITTGNNSAAIGYTTYSSAASSFAIGRGASAENMGEGVLGDVGLSTTNAWIIPGTFTVNGTKNFEIPHPKPEKIASHVIRHGVVESPTAGDTLYRYKVQAAKENDIQYIDLPDYFIWLNKDVQIFVTPQGHFGNGYGILNRETEQLEIHCQYAREYNVLIIGTRNDVHQSVQNWDIKGVEREIGESWTGETYVFSVDEIIEVEEIKEVVHNEYNYKVKFNSI